MIDDGTFNMAIFDFNEENGLVEAVCQMIFGLGDNGYNDLSPSEWQIIHSNYSQ